MNLRVVTFLSYEGDEKEIKDLVADYCEILIARGFANDPEDSESNLKSLVVVKENLEILGMQAEVFFESELQDSLLVVIPTDEAKIVKENSDKLKEIAEDDGACQSLK